MHVVWIGVAGFAGAVARYGLSTAVARAWGDGFPWGTLTVNAVGSFALAALLAGATDRLGLDPVVRTALAVGFLGSFTTFSTFAYETTRLIDAGTAWLAAVNVVASVATSIGGVYAGSWLARAAG